MADKGKRDKGKKEAQKKGKQTLKEKRKQKKDKRNWAVQLSRIKLVDTDSWNAWPIPLEILADDRKTKRSDTHLIFGVKENYKKLAEYVAYSLNQRKYL